MKAIVIALSLAALLSADGGQSFTGLITDTMCGAKHVMAKDMTQEQCVRMCVKESSDYALYDGKDVWKLSDQKKAAQFSANQVIVTGTANTSSKTIKVVSIEASK